MRFPSSVLFLQNPSPKPSFLHSFSRYVGAIRRRSLSPGRDNHRPRSPGSIRSPVGAVSTAASRYSAHHPTMAVVAGAAVEEASLARRFWIRSRREAIFASYTPFVVCLAAGKLDLDTFRNYIAQDVHFLRAFAQAYEKAEEYADDDDAKAAIVELRNAVLEESKLHNSIVQEWGIDPTKAIIASPATTKYADFLLATAAGKVEGGKGTGNIVTPFEKTKIAAYTVGAMTPCMRLYSFLGKELQMILPPEENDHPYQKWIENYSSKGFETSAIQIEELLDKLSVSLTGEELEVIEKLYRQAMKLEIEFFSAQPVQQVVVPLMRVHDPLNRLIIFSDFDLTCTVVDSSAIIAEIAILKAPKSDQSGADTSSARRTSSDMRKLWDTLSKQYTEEYEQCIESILLSERATTFNYEGLHKGLELLSDFEKQANSRVIESEVLQGMSLDEIRRAGELLILQDGCKDFFLKVVKMKEMLNVDLHVLSYCWCADLIRSALSSGGLDVLNIHSNEFEYEESVSTGKIVRQVESPLNKVDAFKSLLNSSSTSGKHLTVYIGDSVGDLLCLLEADVGIVIGSSASLRRLGTHFGVSFIPLFSGVVEKQRQLAGEDSSIWKGLSGVLYTVSSWSEVQAFILGE